MWISYSSFSPIHWLRNHHLLRPHRKLRLHNYMLESIHTNCWPLSTAQWRKRICRRRQQIINVSQLIWLCYDNVHASRIFRETLKTWRKKTDINETYEIFYPFMNQQEDDCLNNQPTSGTAGFSNAMVDRIVHDKNSIIHQSNGTLLPVFIWIWISQW